MSRPLPVIYDSRSPAPYHSQRPPLSNGSELDRQLHSFSQHPPQSNSRISLEVVARVQYDRCVIECKNWETKYNELYLKFLNLSARAQEGDNNAQLAHLKEENWNLRRQLSEQKDNSRRMLAEAEAHFTQMLDRHKEATLKECRLLVDRLRLQSRTSDYA